MTWQVRQADFDLLLPDCVAVEGTNVEDIRPLVFTPNEHVNTVFMPVTSRRVLVGHRDPLLVGLPPPINAMLAKCSQEYFVAQQRTKELEKLVPYIGTMTETFMDARIKESLERALKI